MFPSLLELQAQKPRRSSLSVETSYVRHLGFNNVYLDKIILGPTEFDYFGDPSKPDVVMHSTC
jgi:hypothetical protein